MCHSSSVQLCRSSSARQCRANSAAQLWKPSVTARVGEVMEAPVEDQEAEEDTGGLRGLAAEGTWDQAAPVEEVGGTAAAAAEEGEEGMEAAESRAPSVGRERMWSFLVRGLGGGLVGSRPGVVGKMTVRGGRAGWRIAEAADSPVLDPASQVGGVLEVRAILVMVGQGPVEDMEAQVEDQVDFQVVEQVGEGQEDSRVEEETEDMELPVEDLAVKCRCSSVLLSRSKSVRAYLDNSARQ